MSTNPSDWGVSILLSKDNKRVVQVNIASNYVLDHMGSLNGRLFRIPDIVSGAHKMEYCITDCLTLEQIHDIGCFLEGYTGHKVSWTNWINKYLNYRYK